ncbi:MAG: MBL fold metallo-hydrolase [Desulfovibrionaceae bacterium]
MIVRSWGARGSIPVSGPEFVKYGGDTTCIEIRTKNDEIIIIDAGSGIRRLANSLLDQGRYDYTFLFTHAHWDHILGFPFFKPLYSKKARILIHGCNLHQGNMEMLLSRTMDAPYFPVPYSQVQADIEFTNVCFSSLRIDSLTVRTIPLSHPNMGLGYSFEEDGKRFVFLTDNELGFVHRGGLPFDDYVEFARGADLLFHDAEYIAEEYEYRKTWGHSSFLDATDLAARAGVRRFGLYHHNQDRPDAGVDAMVEVARRRAAADGVALECFGVTQNFEIEL